MHVDVSTLYGTKISLDFDLPKKAKEFKVSITSQNIFQDAYSHLIGNECFTTKQISNVAELINVLSELNIPEKLNSRIQHYSQHNTKFKASSYDFFKSIFINIDKDCDEESHEEMDIPNDPQSTLWGFVEDVPKTDEVHEKKYDEDKLESIRKNTCKLIKLILNDQKLIIQLEGTDLPEISGKVEPSMQRLAMGEILLNLQKHSLDKLGNEQQAEAISSSLIGVLKNNIFSILDKATSKHIKKLDALIKTIAKDCIDAGLSIGFSLDEPNEAHSTTISLEETDEALSTGFSLDEPNEALSTTPSLEETDKIVKPYKTEVIKIRRAGMLYIAETLKEMKTYRFASTDPTIEKLEVTSKYLKNNKNILQVMALVNDAHEDIIFYYEKYNLALTPSNKMLDLAAILENEIQNAGFKNLRSFDF